MSDSARFRYRCPLARACLSGLAALCLAGPVAAAPASAPGAQDVAPGVVPDAVPDAATATPPRRSLSLSEFLSDDEQGMLFEYLRDVFFASLSGDEEEASMAPELAFKLSILRQRLIREGDAAARRLVLALQKEVERSLRKKQSREDAAPPLIAPGRP